MLADVTPVLDGFLSFASSSMEAFATFLRNNKDTLSALYYFLGLFGLLSLPVAIITAIVGYRAFRSNRTEQLFANAIQTYRRHLELAVQWPNLAEPEENGIVPGHQEYGRYEWYVGVLLRACEELLQHAEIMASKFPQWERTIQHSLAFHSKYFCESEWFVQEAGAIYSERLLGYIASIVADRRRRIPKA